MIFQNTQRIIKKLYRRIAIAIELNKYNDFTISTYFREQGARIGNNNRIEVRSLGAEPYLVSIGNHCTIAPGVSFITHDGATWLFTDEIPSLQKFEPIRILDNCFIGLNAILIGDITIGPNSIVAAGAVVTKDVPPNSIVGGNPAKVIKSIDQYKKEVVKLWHDLKPDGYFEGFERGTGYSPEYIQKTKLRDLHLLKKRLMEHHWKN